MSSVLQVAVYAFESERVQVCAGGYAVEVVVVIGQGGVGYDVAGDGAAVRKDVVGVGVGSGVFPGCVVKEVFGHGGLVKTRVGEVDAVVYHGDVDAGAGQGVVAVDQADVGPGFGKAGEPVVFVAFEGGIGCVFGDQRGFFRVEAFQGDTAVVGGVDLARRGGRVRWRCNGVRVRFGGWYGLLAGHHEQDCQQEENCLFHCLSWVLDLITATEAKVYVLSGALRAGCPVATECFAVCAVAELVVTAGAASCRWRC